DSRPEEHSCDRFGRSVAAAWCVQPFISLVPPSVSSPPGPRLAKPHIVAKETLRGDAHGVGARTQRSLASFGHVSRPDALLCGVGLACRFGYNVAGNGVRTCWPRGAPAGACRSVRQPIPRGSAPQSGRTWPTNALRSVRASRAIRPEIMLDHCSSVQYLLRVCSVPRLIHRHDGNPMGGGHDTEGCLPRCDRPIPLLVSEDLPAAHDCLVDACGCAAGGDVFVLVGGLQSPVDGGIVAHYPSLSDGQSRV